MEKEGQSNVEYKGPSVQGKTGEEISRSICGSIYHWGGSIYQCSQITTANLDENSPGCEHQSNSMI